MKNLSLLFVVTLFMVTCTVPSEVIKQSENTPPPEIKQVDSKKIQTSEILWDSWGIPHIYATNEKDLYYGMGWAQMHSHGDLLMKLYAEARGEAPKYLGESALALTKQLHTIGIPDLGRKYYDQLTAEEKSVLTSFVAGINAYAATHPNHIAEHLRGVLPILVTDVNAHSLRNFFIEFIGNREMGKARSAEIGSNTWAISPQRSTSGNALLLANPHLRYDDLWLFYEVNLVTDDYNIYGSTLVGMPTIGIAFNEHLGWSHTVNTLDAADLYRLTLDGEGYVLDGEQKAFTSKSFDIEVLQADGSLKTETFPTLQSVHGPIVNRGEKEAIALRLARLEDPGHRIHSQKTRRRLGFLVWHSTRGRFQIPMGFLPYL